MSISKIIIFFMIAFLVLLWVSPTISQMTPGQKIGSFYGAFIDDCILKCESKVSLRHSKLIHIRQEVAKHCLKADFLKRHKGKLVEELIAKDIGTKHYKIHYYLNNRFYSELRLAMKTPHS